MWWFLSYINMNWPWVHMCPPILSSFYHSWDPLSDPPYPSGLSQSTDFECLASFIELPMVICFAYGNVHVSVLFSQIIPPFHSPTESKKSILYICLLCWPEYRIVITIFPNFLYMRSVKLGSVVQSFPILCDPMNHSTPGLPVHHQLPEFTQTQVHRVNDAIQPSHPLSSPSPPAPNPSQHQRLFQWVNTSHEVAKVLEFQFQHHSLQRNPRADLLQNWLVGSPCSPRDSQESSPIPQFKSINSLVFSFLHSPSLTSTHNHWKNHSLD